MTDVDPAGAAPGPGAFRDVIGRLPAGVCVVTTRWRGQDQAATVSSAASVSLEPPLVLFCVHADARLREALDEVPHWALSVLAASAQDVADWLASPGRPAVGQLDRVAHHAGPATGMPLVDRCAAWLECRTAAIHPAGDHDIVVGEVLAAGATGEPGGLVHVRGRLRPIV